MELHEEAGAVRREVVIERSADEVWEDVRELSWLERDAQIVEEEAPSRLSLTWVDDDSTVVDVRVIEEEESVTRVVVVETPVAVLRAVSDAVVVGSSAQGPMALAA